MTTTTITAGLRLTLTLTYRGPLGDTYRLDVGPATAAAPLATRAVIHHRHGSWALVGTSDRREMTIPVRALGVIDAWLATLPVDLAEAA